MSNTTPEEDKYTDAPEELEEAIRTSVIIPGDFLSPEEIRREFKRTITIRLDPDVYEWFQLPGPGYQTRINAVLKAYVVAKRHEKQVSTNKNVRKGALKSEIEKMARDREVEPSQSARDLVETLFDQREIASKVSTFSACGRVFLEAFACARHLMGAPLKLLSRNATNRLFQGLDSIRVYYLGAKLLKRARVHAAGRK